MAFTEAFTKYCFSYCAIGVKAISEVMKWQPTATIAVPWSKLNAQALELHAAASASLVYTSRDSDAGFCFSVKYVLIAQ